MNRLWIRLSLAFTAVILLAMILIGITIRVTLGTATQMSEVQASIEQRREDSPPIDMTTAIVIVGTVAIIAGVGMSKSLTAPLDELGEAAQAIGRQDLSQRVTVHGSAEIRAVADSFNQMAYRLETAETLRQNLLADVAHELRHPIHILKGNLHAILDDIYPLSKGEIARLVDQTNHLTTLINDLHELAQAEAQQLPLHKQTTDIAQLVKDVTAVFKPVATAKQIELQVELLGAMPIIEVDTARMRQVLHNLFDNALRHTPGNGRIHITIEQTEDGLQIKVTDSGAGIKPEDMPHVFDRFYRADSARSREQGSAGLGLAIVRAIVEAHGGIVTVTSPGQGQGSTFTLTLPQTKRA